MIENIPSPIWTEIKPKSDRYVRGEVMMAGYTLTDYIDAQTEDCTPIIQALLDRLAEEQGGALYIPEGEYVCRGPITVHPGTTLVGDWEVPDGKSPVCGTILVYRGPAQSEEFKTPFVTIQPNACARDLAFWYPEQSEKEPIAYPATLRTSYWNVAKEITLINSWVGIDQIAGDSPSMYSIYGTALSVGIFDVMVTDIMRIEDTYFSPDYWLNSGKFTGDEAALRHLLYTTAIGVQLERTDWSYYTESAVDGYYKGVVYNSGSCYGQNYDLHIQNCYYGIYSHFTHGNGQELTKAVIENCEYGIYAPDDGVCSAITMNDVTIAANKEAISLHCNGKHTFVDSTIVKGAVTVKTGMLAAINSTFKNKDAIKVLVSGKGAVLLTGNAGLDEENVCIRGEECACQFNPKMIPNVVAIRLNSKQGAAAKTISKRPRNSAVYSADTLAAALGFMLDNTGSEDMTDVLNTCLKKVGEQGGAMYLPGGHYRITAPLTIPADVELFGALDCARVPHNVGTVLDVDFEEGNAIVMNTRSGLRGFTICYLGQQDTWILEHGAPRAYDFAVYAKDAADVYVINVSSFNVYNGVCLDGCDRHYVEGLAGCFLNRGVVVKNSVDGIVRDCQFNIQAIFRNYGWPAAVSYRYNTLPEEKLRTVANYFFDQLQDVCETFVLDNITDEMVYGCFTYGGGKALVVSGKDTTAMLVGFAGDFVTKCVDVRQGREINMINTQTTPLAYTEYTNKRLKEVYGVHLHDTFDGIVNMANIEAWTQPHVIFKAEGGTLNATNINTGCGLCMGDKSYVDSVTLAQVTDNAKMNITAILQYNPGVLVEDVSIVNGGFCGSPQLITAENMMKSTERYGE